MPSPLESILISLEDPILCLNDQHAVIWLNEAAAQLLGAGRPGPLPPGATRPQRLIDVVRQLDLPELAARPPGPKPRKAIRRIELAQPPPAEPLVWEATLTEVRHEGKTLFTAVFHGVSLLLRLEQAVYEARKTQALAALAGGIAHDFNNILTAVISQIDLTLDAPDFPAGLRDHLIYAQTSARRGAELIGRLATFSRQSKSEFVAVEMQELIEQTVFMLKRSFDPRISIVCPAPNATPWLARADSHQITQALLNLAINARDAMPHGGQLTFELANIHWATPEATPPRKAGDFLRISVSDTGHGMTPEVAAHIMEPYFTTKDRSRGQGLGLSITSAVVSEHGGWMEVESRPGHGSRFSIFLPRSLETESVAAPVAVVDPKTTEGKECLLIVDDEDLVRLVTKAVLAYRGYKVVEAADGQDAVEKYAASPDTIDLVLMDMHMPRMNGYDALQQIRQINPQAAAIMLSGGVHDPEAGIADLEGVAFLHKPFDNQELVRLVRQTLDGRPQRAP